MEGKAQSAHILFFTLALLTLPPSFTNTLTRPGFAQSRGCVFPGSNTVFSPSNCTASTISLASGFLTACETLTRRPSERVLFRSKYKG